MTVESFVFWILALLTIGSALGVIVFRNLVHSALYMVLTFVGVAGLYVLLYADFLAAVQILVYAGAIAILIVFGVMLTQRRDMQETNTFGKLSPISGLVAFCLVAVISLSVVQTNWVALSDQAPPDSTVDLVAGLMMTNYVVPFEVAAILLLVAMIGAIILAKGERSR